MRTLSLGPLIAALSSSILSLTAGHHLSYVIAAVSGAGVIAIVPLAIFAVSTVVALISVAYLVKLAVSRADNKKEASGKEEPDWQAKPTKELAEEFAKKLVEELNRLLSQPCSVSQESTEKSVHKNTNPKNRPSMSTPTPPPVTLGAQRSPSASVPPPSPPPPPLPGFQNSSTRSDSANAELKNTKPEEASDSIDRSALLTQIQKGNFPLKKVVNPNKPEAAKKPSSGDRENLLAQIRKGVELKPAKPKKDEQQRQPNTADQDIAQILARRAAIEHSDSEDEHENGVSDSEWEDDDEHSTSTIPQQVKPKKDEQQSNVTGYMASIPVRRVPEEFSNSESEGKHENSVSDSEWEENDEHSTSIIPQSDNEKRSESPDSGNVSEDDAKSQPTSPLHFSAPEAKKPLLPPKPANLQTKSKALPVKEEGDINSVNSEVQDPSTLPVKERARMFENYKGKYYNFPS